MAKSVPTASFRRAVSPAAIEAFIELDDAPGDTPLPTGVLPIRPLESTAIAAEVPDSVPSAPIAEPTEKSSSRARERTPRWRRKTLRRSDGRELRKQTFYLDAELSHRLMVRCAERQYELSEAIEEAVNLWLAKKA